MGTSPNRLTGGVRVFAHLSCNCGQLCSRLSVAFVIEELSIFARSLRTTSRRSVMSKCWEGTCQQRRNLPAAGMGRLLARKSRAQCGEKRMEHSAPAKAAKAEK